MTACEQIRVRAVVVDCFSDPGLRRIRCGTVLHRSLATSFNCGLSNAKISVSASAMKNIVTKKPDQSSSRIVVTLLWFYITLFIYDPLVGLLQGTFVIYT